MDNISDLVENVKIKVDKLESYNTIKMETARLLVREKTIFVINSIVTVGLIITLFRVI